MRRGHAAAGVWAGLLPADAEGSVWHCAQLPQVAVAWEAGHLQVVAPALGPWQLEHQVCMLVAAPCLPILLAGNPCNPYSEQSGWLPWLGRMGMGAAHCGRRPCPPGKNVPIRLWVARFALCVLCASWRAVHARRRTQSRCISLVFLCRQITGRTVLFGGKGPELPGSPSCVCSGPKAAVCWGAATQHERCTSIHATRTAAQLFARLSLCCQGASSHVCSLRSCLRAAPVAS